MNSNTTTTTTSSSSNNNQDESIFESINSIFSSSPQPQQPPKTTTAAVSTTTPTKQTQATAAATSTNSLKPPSPATTAAVKQTLLTTTAAKTTTPTPTSVDEQKTVKTPEQMYKSNADDINFGLNLLGENARRHIESFNSSNILIKKIVQSAQDAAIHNMELVEEGCNKMISESKSEMERRCNATTSCTVQMNDTADKALTSMKTSASSITYQFSNLLEKLSNHVEDVIHGLDKQFNKLKRKTREFDYDSDGEDDEDEENSEEADDAQDSGSESSDLSQTPELTQPSAKKKTKSTAVDKQTIAKRVAETKALAKPQTTTAAVARPPLPTKTYAQTTIKSTAAIIKPVIKKTVTFTQPSVSNGIDSIL